MGLDGVNEQMVARDDGLLVKNFIERLLPLRCADGAEATEPLKKEVAMFVAYIMRAIFDHWIKTLFPIHDECSFTAYFVHFAHQFAHKFRIIERDGADFDKNMKRKIKEVGWTSWPKFKGVVCNMFSDPNSDDRFVDGEISSKTKAIEYLNLMKFDTSLDCIGEVWRVEIGTRTKVTMDIGKRPDVAPEVQIV